jgi:hypothetical protein
MKRVAFALVVCLLAVQLVQASSAVEHLKAKVQGDSLPATKMVAGASKSNECNEDPCANQNEQESGPSVNEALQPVDDWLKAFKKRTGAGGGDLFAAAKQTVAPLLEKLKATQEAAIEKLKESNDAIRRHVEEAATEHVYNLLRSGNKKEEEKEEVEKKKADKEEAEENAKEAEDEKKAAQEDEKATEKAVKKEQEEDKEATKENKKEAASKKF